jgi:hypothetical protein
MQFLTEHIGHVLMSGAAYASLTVFISFVNAMTSGDIFAYVTFALHLL